MYSPARQEILDSRYPNKDIIVNRGKKWTKEDEDNLLVMLKNDESIKNIAEKYKRTLGGIHARREKIANDLYLKNYSIEEISEKTKLDKNQIERIIEKYAFRKKISEEKREARKAKAIEKEILKKKKEKKKKEKERKNQDIMIQNEIKISLDKRLSKIESDISDILSMLKAIYEFEEE